MQFDESYTEFLPAKRATQDLIMQSFRFFDPEKFVKIFFTAFHGSVLILNFKCDNETVTTFFTRYPLNPE